MDFPVCEVKALLKALTGYEASAQDDLLIRLATADRVEYVRAFCNRRDIPRRLRPHLLKMIAGEFLCQKIQSGGLDLSELGIEDSPVVTQTTIEDTTVSFDADGEANPAAVFLSYAEGLRDGEAGILQEFRRLRW